MKNKIVDNENHDFYFRYHHSAGDSMLMMDADDLDDNVVAIASIMFLIADLDDPIPKNWYIFEIVLHWILSILFLLIDIL